MHLRSAFSVRASCGLIGSLRPLSAVIVFTQMARKRAADGDVRARSALGVSRVVKTLLLANVVESKRVLESMDIRRAVHLNHGSIRADSAARCRSSRR